MLGTLRISAGATKTKISLKRRGLISDSVLRENKFEKTSITFAKIKGLMLEIWQLVA